MADALKGIEAAHPGLRVDHEHKVIYRADAPVTGKVGLVSGGGSGHEPLHGGFVGVGMLDAACPGEVFTSPTPDQMLAATSLVDGGAGVVHIVKNYTGDVMNFEMAAELAAESTGAKVESIVTNDDVAVEDSLYTAGRRGVGVTVLVEKLCGAAAEAGQDLASVAAIGRKANGWGRSMGMALTSCTVPAAGQPTFELGDDEVEIGIGIHGEPGRFREPLGTAAEIAERLLEPIVADLPFVAGDPVLAFVNGMGGTPLLELYVMFGEVTRILAGHGLTIARSLVGSYITSLEMAGCSITLLKLDDELIRLWDAPVRTPALNWGSQQVTTAAVTVHQLEEWIRAFAALVAEQKGYLTELDSAIGDADHGINMDRGMRAVLDKLDSTRAGDGRRAVQARRHDAGQQRRRRQRTALRHLLPAARLPRRGPSPSCRPTIWPRHCGPGSTDWWHAASRSSATRRCTTPSIRPSRRSRQPSPAEPPPVKPSTRPPRRAAPDVTRRSRWSLARAGPATSANAAPDTRIPAQRPRRCSSTPPRRRLTS